MYYGNFNAQVNPDNLDSFAVCDRCGKLMNHSDLQFQYDWAGTELINLGIMVGPECYDKPFEPRRVIILPPDPVPIENPRPATWAIQEQQNVYTGVDGVTYSGDAPGNNDYTTPSVWPD